MRAAAANKLTAWLVTSGILNAADFGVPQRRKRAIILASRTGKLPLPTPTHGNPQKSPTLFQHGLLPWETVARAIDDLPAPAGIDLRVGEVPPPLDLHFGRTPTPKSLSRYLCVPEGGNRFDLQRKRLDLTPNCWIRKKSGGTDLFGRLWRDRPAFTIRTEFFKPEKGRYLIPINTDRLLIERPPACSHFQTASSFWEPRSRLPSKLGMPFPPCWLKMWRKFFSNTSSGLHPTGYSGHREKFCD